MLIMLVCGSSIFNNLVGCHNYRKERGERPAHGEHPWTLKTTKNKPETTERTPRRGSLGDRFRLFVS